MASHRQESKIYFICSHVKRQSLYKLQSTNLGYKRELYFSFLFLGWRKSLFEGRCWSPSSYFVLNDVLTSWKGLISSLYICITILTHQKKKKKKFWPMSQSPLFTSSLTVKQWWLFGSLLLFLPHLVSIKKICLLKKGHLSIHLMFGHVKNK